MTNFKTESVRSTAGTEAFLDLGAFLAGSVFAGPASMALAVKLCATSPEGAKLSVFEVAFVGSASEAVFLE